MFTCPNPFFSCSNSDAPPWNLASPTVSLWSHLKNPRVVAPELFESVSLPKTPPPWKGISSQNTPVPTWRPKMAFGPGRSTRAGSDMGETSKSSKLDHPPLSHWIRNYLTEHFNFYRASKSSNLTWLKNADRRILRLGNCETFGLVIKHAMYIERSNFAKRISHYICIFLPVGLFTNYKQQLIIDLQSA